MFGDDNPTGCAYIQTFQAIFQLTELLLVLIAWALLASQHFFVSPALSFSFGALLFIWLLTLFFFLMYLSGYHMKVNRQCIQMIVDSPPPRQRRRHCCCNDVPWFVIEYWLYFLMDILLIAAMVIVSIHHVHNPRFIATAVLGWLATIAYLIHTVLLVRNTEGVWPHQAAAQSCMFEDNGSEEEFVVEEISDS